jgi:hypothetical protein
MVDNGNGLSWRSSPLQMARANAVARQLEFGVGTTGWNWEQLRLSQQQISAASSSQQQQEARSQQWQWQWAVAPQWALRLGPVESNAQP